MSKQDAKNLFKDGVTTWEEKTMHDFIDLLYDKDIMVLSKGSGGSQTLPRYQYQRLEFDKVQFQTGNSLLFENNSVRVKESGVYLILSTTIMKPDIFGDFNLALQTRTGNALGGSTVWCDTDKYYTLTGVMVDSVNSGETIYTLLNYVSGSEAKVQISGRTTMVVIKL